MKIYDIKCCQGKNVHSHKPIIKMVVDIGKYHEIPTCSMDKFNERLLELFPGLKKHCCSLGYEGGFVERLKEGTYIPHVMEHLIIEMQNIAGYDVAYGKARVKKEPSLYNIIFQYENEACAFECARTAVNIITALIDGREIDITDILDNIKNVAVESELGPTSKAIFEEAKRRGIPVRRLGNESVLRLGYGKYSRIIEASLTDSTKCVSVDMAGNKHLTRRLLSSHGIPVPEGDIAYTYESACMLAEEIGYPVIVKPFDSNQGKGVTVNICNEKQLKNAYEIAMKISKAVIVEKHIKGRDYRVLVVGGKVSAASERRPPFVIGDGIHSIRELVDIENQNPMRGDDHEKPLTKIKFDSTVMHCLSINGMNEFYIPEKGKIVYLRSNGNISTGGTARECTGELHPYNAEIAVKAAEIMGLDIAGIDIVAQDISVPIDNILPNGEQNGAVIEVNAAPGLRMHLYPSEGKSVNVAADIIDMMFPDAKKCTIPIVSITGTNGKTTTSRLISHIMALTGKCVGMTSTSGIYINNKCILRGDNTGPSSAEMVLYNKEVEVAVLETARGGMIRKGLAYDLADVGVITNISDDHLGIDGIETLEDLAFVKSLVVEAVKPDGHSVINADDPMAEYIIKRAAGNIVLFSMKKDNPLIIKHIENNGKAVYIDKNKVVVKDKDNSVILTQVNEIPITFNGVVECNIQNSLAAVAATYALGIDADIIRQGLISFKPDVVTNPGRFNVFDVADFKVILDYGHNSAGYEAMASFIRNIDAKRKIGIIGIPGDRLDRNIYEVGRISAGMFSYIYIKEDNDLRGRQPGEVANILYNSVIENGMHKDNVDIIYSESLALSTAIENAMPGDLIVMFYEDFDKAYEIVMKYKDKFEAKKQEEGQGKNTEGQAQAAG
mgnify:CR=1 FL=1